MSPISNTQVTQCISNGFLYPTQWLVDRDVFLQTSSLLYSTALHRLLWPLSHSDTESGLYMAGHFSLFLSSLFLSKPADFVAVISFLAKLLSLIWDKQGRVNINNQQQSVTLAVHLSIRKSYHPTGPYLIIKSFDTQLSHSLSHSALFRVRFQGADGQLHLVTDVTDLYMGMLKHLQVKHLPTNAFERVGEDECQWTVYHEKKIVEVYGKTILLWQVNRQKKVETYGRTISLLLVFVQTGSL